MLKIGILSDSHKKTTLTKDAVDLLKSQNAQYLVHAGDLEIKENLDILKNSGLVYVSVFGNNDYNLVKYSQEYKINQEPYYFSIKEHKFKLMHIPNYMSPDSDIVIFGHTHIFEHQYINETLYLNPGEICAREQDKTQCILLSINDEKYIIEYFYKTPQAKKWEKETIEYTR
jgi:putative phosphoesterase